MKGLKGIAGTLVTVFVVAALSAFINGGGDVFAVDMTGLKAIVSAGILALAAFLVAYLNPSDERYGLGSSED